MLASAERWVELNSRYLELARQQPDKFNVALYEELLEAPITTTQRLFKWAGLDFPATTRKFIKSSRKRTSDDPYDIYRKPENLNTNWRYEMDPDYVRMIEDTVKNTGPGQFYFGGQP